MKKTGFCYHPDYLNHITAPGHPERPERLVAILNYLEETSFFERLLILEPRRAERNCLEAVHGPGYIDLLQGAFVSGRRYLDPDTPICESSFDVALLAAGAGLSAVDAVAMGTMDNCFCAVRPPGHHAERDKAMGFCLLNNAAIAARYAQSEYGFQKILMVDFDVHHGNGTQHIFESDPKVFYFSTHQYPHYPGTGSSEEYGVGPGAGYTLNIPMPPGTGDDEIIGAYKSLLYPAAVKFNPDFIIISAGFDAHRDDPLSAMTVTEDGFHIITDVLVEIADRCCSGRVVSLLEGGYNLGALARSAQRHIAALLGE